MLFLSQITLLLTREGERVCTALPKYDSYCDFLQLEHLGWRCYTLRRDKHKL